ncbi:hypothetical protein LXL04_037565 [Taraxacum kok-saghyz]
MAPEETVGEILEDPLGCVTPFALVNESAQHVSLMLDEGFKSQECCFFHSLSNDTTISIGIKDVDMFLKSVGRRVAYVDLEANPPVGKDQPPDLAALVPSDTTNIKEVMEKTASLKIYEAVNSKPASVTVKASKHSGGLQKEKSTKTGNSFADPEKFIEEILEKASSLVVSEMLTCHVTSCVQIKDVNIEKNGQQLGDVVSSLLKKKLTLEFQNLATMFKNTAYTEVFTAGTHCPQKRL